jgi:hypothetical protein
VRSKVGVMGDGGPGVEWNVVGLCCCYDYFVRMN